MTSSWCRYQATVDLTILFLMTVIMMLSSNGNIFRVTGPLWGESNGDRWIPITRSMTQSFEVFVDLCLSKQSRRRRFETPSLWRHCNDNDDISIFIIAKYGNLPRIILPSAGILCKLINITISKWRFPAVLEFADISVIFLFVCLF